MNTEKTKPEISSPKKASIIEKIFIGSLSLLIISLSFASYSRGLVAEEKIDKNFSNKKEISSYGTISCDKLLGWFGTTCEIKNITVKNSTISTMKIFSPHHIFFGKKGNYALNLYGIQGDDVNPEILINILRKNNSFDLPFEVESTNSSQWGRTMKIYIPLLKTR